MFEAEFVPRSVDTVFNESQLTAPLFPTSQ
jgi:hypothetical protein